MAQFHSPNTITQYHFVFYWIWHNSWFGKSSQISFKYHVQENTQGWRQWFDLVISIPKTCVANIISCSRRDDAMGLLPDRQNCGCTWAGNAGNVFPDTVGKRSRHASWHVRDARAVMHAGIPKIAVSFEVGGRAKRSRHSRRMRNPQFYVSGKRPIQQFVYERTPEEMIELLLASKLLQSQQSVWSLFVVKHSLFVVELQCKRLYQINIDASCFEDHCV